MFKTIMDDIAGYNLESRLPGIKAPTLLVWGNADQLVPPSTLETFKRLIASSRGILIEHVGHVPQTEARDKCARDYIAFRGGIVELRQSSTPATETARTANCDRDPGF
jgi:pimeloyl-ACP methyl ester carboxylesterase